MTQRLHAKPLSFFAKASLLLTVALLFGCGQSETPNKSSAATNSDKTLVFTAIPDQDTRQLEQRFARVRAVLEEKLGVNVVYKPVKSYSAAVTAFVNDEVQLAWFGGFSGVQARLRQPGAKAIAQGINDPNYYSVLIAHSSTGLEKIDTLNDSLKGRSLTFGSKGSTSGRLMPEFFIRDQFGKAPGDVFSRIGYSGDHSRTIQLVQAGSYDLGVLGYTVWTSEMARGNIDTSKVQAIWESPRYPDYQFTVRGDVDERFGEGFSEKIQNTILGFKDPELLASFSRKGFIKASNSDFDPIENTARSVGLIGGE